MELGDLEFKPEDFCKYSANVRGVCRHGYQDEDDCEGERHAENANNLLRERLKKSPKMLCRIDGGFWAADGHDGFARSSHVARLVAIEEIGK